MAVTTFAVSKTKLKHPPLTVHRLGDRSLRQPAKRIAKVDDSIRLLATQMLQTMYSLDGLGLAAPQVGIAKQLIVVDIAWDKPEEPPLVLINPEIKAITGDYVLGEEGCLSVPDVFLDVQRQDKVTVAYRDLDGRPQRLTTDGLLARVIQHEIDHLNGVMFVDRVKNPVALNRALTQKGFSVKDVQHIA